MDLTSIRPIGRENDDCKSRQLVRFKIGCYRFDSMYRSSNSVGKFVVLLVVVCMAPGCMLMFRGTTEEFKVETIPEGAQVQFSNGYTCKSPCTAEVARRKTLEVSISRAGCKNEEFKVPSRYEGRMFAAAGASYVGVFALIGVAALTTAFSSSSTSQDLGALGLLAGMVLFVGGIPTDLAAGPMRSHSPNPLEVTLDCS